ncbi:unnamed protein product [Gadus morhua 'NCC']
MAASRSPHAEELLQPNSVHCRIYGSSDQSSSEAQFRGYGSSMESSSQPQFRGYGSSVESSPQPQFTAEAMVPVQPELTSARIAHV